MTDELDSITSNVIPLIQTAQDLNQLEQIRIDFLGKKGLITAQMEKLKLLPNEEKKSFGAKLNQLKLCVSDAIESKKYLLEQENLNKKLSSESVDVTLPIRAKNLGSIHQISFVIEECKKIFQSLGFSIKEGPEIETDFYNFSALNIPSNHPARQMQDTFYINDKAEDGTQMLLRTHTSSVQIRSMINNKPPFRFIAPGRVYRSDYDMTHTPMFHQIEGVCISDNINMGHLKGCLHDFLSQFFGIKDFPLRFRTSFFPFTEPSAEVDIGYSKKGEQILIGNGDKWLEILGCGMIHPNVLKNIGIDPEQYQGFAFGVGVERLAMLKYGAPDLRAFFDSDMRWLNHYGFKLNSLGGLI